jgi:hypothetical protein
MNFKNITLVSFMVLLIILCVVFGPLIVIWSLNTLFPVLAIPYNIWTWLAIIGINASIRGIFYNLKVTSK